MPALLPTAASLLETLAVRADAANTSLLNPNTTTSAPLQVICAWPVSGQYGPGSRILYYVLVAACVLARKSEWLRNACLAAALLFPAVAAVHGIILAILHNDAAVDMDVFGAFQLCAIGILAAPVTVRISKTYFYDPGRNTIFLWTGLVLAGLLSLTVEFYRIQTVSCLQDGNGNPPPTNVTDFLRRVDNENITCGMTCDVERGPFSSMRRGSANNIYVIPSPTVLAFGTATLMAAGCCIPAILSMVTMWGKILEINWKARFGNRTNMDQLIEGTNGATVGTMKGVNDMVRFFLSVVEVPVFGGLVLAILIIGEMNFFSDQVLYQTEPMLAVGQWAPIVGTAFAAFGSLYLLLAETVMEETKSTEPPTQPCTCQHRHHDSSDDQEPQQVGVLPPMRRETLAADARAPSPSREPAAEMQEVPGRRRLPRASTYSPGGASAVTDSSPSDSDDVEASAGHQPKRSWTSTTDVAKRRQVAQTLAKLGNVFGSAAHGAFDLSDFRRGRATEFPTIPGEEHRNPDLNRVLRTYNQHRDNADEEGGDINSGIHRQRSRANSFRSVASGADGEAGPSTPRARRALSRSPSPLRSRDTFPRERVSLSDIPSPGSPSSPGSAAPRAPSRRVTLTVPSSSHRGHVRDNSLPSSPRPTIIMTGERSPSIVVSPEPETYSPVDETPSNPAPHHPNSEK